MIRYRVPVKCREYGHNWYSPTRAIPLEWCKRWFCKAERVAPWVEEPLASQLAESIRENPR